MKLKAMRLLLVPATLMLLLVACGGGSQSADTPTPIATQVPSIATSTPVVKAAPIATPAPIPTPVPTQTADDAPNRTLALERYHSQLTHDLLSRRIPWPQGFDACLSKSVDVSSLEQADSFSGKTHDEAALCLLSLNVAPESLVFSSPDGPQGKPHTPPTAEPAQVSRPAMAEDLIPVGSPGSALAPFPENTSPVGDQLTATNSYFQVTFYDRYAFYDDFQMGRIGVQVADLAGQDNDFNIGLTSDIPEGWMQTDNPIGMVTPIPGEGGVLEIGLPQFTSEQPQEGVFALKVWVEGATYEPIEFSITVIGYPQLGRASYGQSDIDAMMTGIVRDASTGQPIAGAEISMWLGPTNRFMPHDMLSVTQSDGSYSLMTWDIDLVNSYFTPYTEVSGYVLMVQRAGYHTYVHGNYVRPRFQSPTNLDISMVPLNDQVDFDVKWDIPLWSPGVWEIEMNDSWDRFALAMGKHPDADDPETWATQLPFIDSNGNILWTKSLPDQSWAVDVSGDGSIVSATTHATRADNFIYVWDQDGKELWRAPLDSESLDVDISMSNQHVATGPPGPSYSLGIYDARTGVKVREFDTNWSKIRQVDFTPDGQHIVAGPMLHMFTLGGETIWRRYEFSGLPYVIWISSDQSRIMIPDKGDFISMYNGNGDLLWRRMLRVLTYGTMSTDGSLVVALSHGGYLHCYNGEGELLWYRRVPVHGDAGGAGHNGVDITPDGKYIAVGGGNYTTLLYDAQGNLLWSHQGTAPIDGSEHPYLHSVMAVRISPDGTKIVSGYGTSDPRLIYFERKLGQ